MMDLTKFQVEGYQPTEAEVDELCTWLMSLPDVALVRACRLLCWRGANTNWHAMAGVVVQWQAPSTGAPGPVADRTFNVIMALRDRFKDALTCIHKRTLREMVELVEPYTIPLGNVWTESQVQEVIDCSSPEDRPEYELRLRRLVREDGWST